MNRAGKMLFTHQLIDSLSADEVAKRVADATSTGEWQFFAFEQPWPELRTELDARYRLR